MNRQILAVVVLLSTATGSYADGTQKHIGDIDFFGYKGLDLPSIRADLPIHEGDAVPDTYEQDSAFRQGVKEAVLRAAGKEPTGIDSVCCDDHGHQMIYIGLPGESSKSFSHNPAPKGSQRLPPDAVKLYDRLLAASGAGVAKGDSGEDDSRGYALYSYPEARAVQLAMRDYALGNEKLIRKILRSSSDLQSRQAAAMLLGYANQSEAQIKGLVDAADDTDEIVRNNAMRALAVLANSSEKTAAKIPADHFIDMLNSGTWTDRNKAGFLLVSMTQSRDQKLLSQLRARSLDSLIEMARWRVKGHAFAARMMLARIAGIDDRRLVELVNSGQVDAIIQALGDAGSQVSTRELKARAEDVITLDRNERHGTGAEKIKETFARIEPSELEPARLKSYDTRTLELLFEAVSIASDRLDRPELLTPMEKIFDECYRRSFIGGMVEELYKKYIHLRELGKARKLADNWPSDSRRLPKIIEPDPPPMDSPAVFVVSSDGKTLTYTPVDLSQPKIITVIDPDCHFGHDLMALIKSDPQLGDAFKKYAVYIDPAWYSLDAEEWARLNAKGVIHYDVLYRASGWKGFDFEGVPHFYFVKDGKIIFSIVDVLPAEFKAQFLEGLSKLEASSR
jgi:hypothetical protein